MGKTNSIERKSSVERGDCSREVLRGVPGVRMLSEPPVDPGTRGPGETGTRGGGVQWRQGPVEAGMQELGHAGTRGSGDQGTFGL